MSNFRFHHHNNCSRCPLIGAEDIPGDEYVELLSLRFNLQIARELCREGMLHRVDAAALERWLERVQTRHTSIIFP